jgi:hypothetical protein
LKNRSYLEDLDLIVTQETELIALRQQAVVLADEHETHRLRESLVQSMWRIRDCASSHSFERANSRSFGTW